MPVGTDETEQLLQKLEAELAEHQKVIDERLAREDAERLELEKAIESWTRRQEQAEVMLESATPRKNQMVHRRDELRLMGAKGNFRRAMAWSGAASLCFIGATVSLATVASSPHFFVITLIEAAALAGGFTLARWLDPGDRR
ncbi:MAG: hypothetical protein QM723_16790 [Myxococcaceae bacterium]